MKVFLRNVLILMALVLLTFLVFKVAVFAQAPTDKYDGDCTGHETAGRCADKPYLPHTPTGCPYGDSIPVDSPKCVPPAENVTSQNVPDTELPQFVDKPVDSGENFVGK